MTNTLLTRIVLLAIFLHFQEKSEAETATQSICPIRPATDTRGPPGLPGRTGSKGDVGMGQKGKKGEKGNMAEVSAIESTLSSMQSNMSEMLGDQGWMVIGRNGNCFQYKKTTTQQNWQTSRELCQAEAGDLAHVGIRDLSIRRQVIRNVLRSDTVWLGLNDIVSEGRFFWVDGDPFRPGELAWINADQPDNQVGNEDCMEFNLSGYAANAINDLVCNRNKRGLCEKPVQY